MYYHCTYAVVGATTAENIGWWDIGGTTDGNIGRNGSDNRSGLVVDRDGLCLAGTHFRRHP